MWIELGKTIRRRIERKQRHFDANRRKELKLTLAVKGVGTAQLLPPCPSPPLRGTALSRHPPGRVTETNRRSPPGRRRCARGGPKGHHRGAARRRRARLRPHACTGEGRHGGAAISCARPDSPVAAAEVCCTKGKKEGSGHRPVTAADRAAHACGAPRPWLLGPAVTSAHGTAG